MKTMRKLFAMVLALTMVLAMATTVNAGTITIENTQDGYTYEVYQMCTYEEGNNGDKWYKVNGEWESFVSQYFNVNETTKFLEGYKSGVTDASFVAALQEWLQTEANYNSVQNTKVVESAYTNADNGYYVLVSKDAEGKIGAKVGADTLTDEKTTISLREKNKDLPTVTKTITDAEGTDYKVGDTVNFKVEISCEEDKTSYTVHDLMQGMDLDEDSVVVKVEDTATGEVKATTNYTLYNPSTENTDSECAEGACSFEIVINFDPATQAYQKVEITYSATVTEDSVEGMTNKAWIDNRSSEVEVEKTSFTLTKTDGTNKLEGAKFELYTGVTNDGETTYTKVDVVAVKDNDNNILYYRPAGENETAEAIVAGEVTVKGLGTDLDYYLKEIEAPAGYVKIDGYKAVSDDNVEIVNTKGEELPETGGMGTTLFYIVGGLMVAGAAILLVTKKRMGAAE